VKRIIVILFLLSVFFLGFLPVKDTDFGWHYRCGNQFLTTGKLCLTNEFSYFLPNYKAYYSGHLYDITLAFIYNHGGFLAVTILGALVFTSSALIFLYLIRAELLLRMFSFIVIFFLSFPIFNIGFRPQILSYYFLLMLLFMLSQNSKKVFFVLPFLFFIWVNIHIGFFIGLIILIFYFFENKPISQLEYSITVVLSFIATLINPFGINVYKEILNHLSSPLNSMIAEWVEPTLPHIIFVLIFTSIGILTLVRNKPLTLWKIFLLIFFSVLAIKARRNLPLFYTSFAFIFLGNIKINLEKFYTVSLPVLISILFFFIFVFVPETIHQDTIWSEYCTNGLTHYPCKALSKFSQLSGNVYAVYEWGGFLIWQKPNMKVFIDGRMPAWKDENGKSPYQVYLEIIQTKDGWNEKLRQWQTNYLLISPGTFLDLLLQKEAKKYQWEEEYRDTTAVIYKAL